MPALLHRPKSHDSAHGYTVPSHWQLPDSHFDGPSAKPRLNRRKSRRRSARGRLCSGCRSAPALPESDVTDDVYSPDKEPADGKDIHLSYVRRDDVCDKP